MDAATLRAEPKGMQKIRAMFNRKGEEEPDMVTGVLPEWKVVERVVDKCPATGHYLIKWCGLPYTEATWEEPEDLEGEQVGPGSDLIPACFKVKYRGHKMRFPHYKVACLLLLLHCSTKIFVCCNVVLVIAEQKVLKNKINDKASPKLFLVRNSPMLISVVLPDSH